MLHAAHLQLRRVALERVDPNDVGARLEAAVMSRGAPRGVVNHRICAAGCQEAQEHTDRQESVLRASLAGHRDCRRLLGVDGSTQRKPGGQGEVGIASAVVGVIICSCSDGRDRESPTNHKVSVREISRRQA